MKTPFLLVGVANAIDWLSLHKIPEQACESLMSENSVHDIRYRLCRGEDPDLIQAVQIAAVQTKSACERTMHDQRWDCKSIKHAPKFKRDLRKGTQERAFVQALSSAAVTINVARRCALGDVTSCNCKYRKQDDRADSMVSRPCEHDLDWAARWTNQWTTVSAVNEKKKYKDMVDQDNTLGRLATRDLKKRICKCHGPSGSCSQSTCWFVAPDIDVVAEELKEMYSKSVKMNRRPERNAPLQIWTANHPHLVNHGGRKKLQMVYVDKSHDYCEKNSREGSTGTKGRECNPHGQGDGSCADLCCGRGFERQTETFVNEQHNCRYVWCCRVVCDTIEETRTKYVCR